MRPRSSPAAARRRGTQPRADDVLGIESGNATVIASSIAAVATILVSVIGVQLKVHKDNRGDHAETAAKVDELVNGQRHIAADVREVKADVRDLRDADRRADTRITALEGKQ